MQAFLINLARRPDRLRVMTEQLNRLSLAFHRIPAVDANTATETWVNGHFAGAGPLGAIPKGDKCCTLSHVRAWQAFLSTGDRFGLILEDDALLDCAAAELLQRTDWIPPSVELLKLEHFGPSGQRVLIGKLISVAANRSIAELHSRHTGAAAYIIGRGAAKTLVSSIPAWTVPVDHMLFNPNVSPLAKRLRPYQLLPAIARQSSALGGETNIDAWRAVQRRLSSTYVKREIVRAYYEMRLLPQQVARLVSRQGTLVRVQNEVLNRALTAPLRTAEALRSSEPQIEHGEALRLRR